MSSNGSMQFLGRQLGEQAKQLGELVLQMKSMVKAMGSYSVASDNVQYEHVYGEGEDGKRHATTGSDVFSFSTYMEGYVRLEVTADNREVSQNVQAKVRINGVDFKTLGTFLAGQITTIFIDVPVSEGDEIAIRYLQMSTKLYVNSYRLKYDLVLRPDSTHNN